MIVKEHALTQGIKRLKTHCGLKFNRKQMKEKIKNVVKYGKEIQTPIIGQRHFQDTKTGLICVVLRNCLVLTVMFPDERYKFGKGA